MRTYEKFLIRGESLHGHRCPSLLYGIRAALILGSNLPPGVEPARIILRHVSGCFRDGVLAVVEGWLPTDRVNSRPTPGSCSIEAVWDGGSLTIGVRPEVRVAVDAIHARTPDLAEYRSAGMAYLSGLADDEFACLTRPG
jgi:hypothetical protein